MLDLHVHLIGHQERKADREALRRYLGAAKSQGLQTIGFSDHDMFWEELNFDLIRQVAAETPELEVLVGLEVDYRPGEEERIRGMLAQFPFDYVIGSVHEIYGWPFDMPDQEGSYRRADPDELYQRYFEIVAQAAQSGLFQIIGHLDLIKLFGVRPSRDILEHAAPALSEIAARALTVEINTNGRYKPVGEFYPERKLIQEIQRRDISFTLGSDAHQPEVVGRDLPEAAELLRSVGVREIASFSGGQKIRRPL
ncbi:MAG: histidinol-phosphatase HisJ family protein [Peptococcaceae bacterium]|nr:histidinol-phosphatase HisJ family protein [Peptococcaceae bacterium]